MRNSLSSWMGRSKWHSFIVGYIALFLFISATYTWIVKPLYYQLSPRSWYFTWAEEQVATSKVGQVLTFKSNREVLVSFPIDYVDVVVCDGGKIASSTNTTFNPKPVSLVPDFDVYSSTFSIDGFIPTEPKTNCVLNSQICMQLPYNVHKCQNISTDKFDIDA